MNLLKETVVAIIESGHTIDDVIFIGSEKSGYCCTWEEFKNLANVEYDNVGVQEVVIDLKVVFIDGSTIWCGVYDGSEWWNFSHPFVKPKDFKKIESLFARNYCENLEKIHEKKVENK